MSTVRSTKLSSPFVHLEQRIIDPYHTFLYLNPLMIEGRASSVYWMHDSSQVERWAFLVQNNLFRNEALPFESDPTLQHLREWLQKRWESVSFRRIPVLNLEWHVVFGNGLEPLYNDMYIFTSEGFHFLCLFCAEAKFFPYPDSTVVRLLFPEIDLSDQVVVAMTLHVRRALFFEGLNGYARGWLDAGRIYERLWSLLGPSLRGWPFSSQYRQIERFLKISGYAYGLQWILQVSSDSR